MDKSRSRSKFIRTQLTLDSEAMELFVRDKTSKSIDMEIFGVHPVHLLFHDSGGQFRKKNKKISDSNRSDNVEFVEMPNHLPFYGVSQDASKVQAFKDEVKTNIDHLLEFGLPISWIVTIPITNSPDLINEAIKHEMDLFFEVLFDIIREYQITQSYEFPPAKELSELYSITSEVNEFARAIFPELKFHFVQLEPFHEVHNIIEHLNNRGDYFHERSIMLENESGQLLTEGAWTRDDEFRFQIEKGLFWMKNSLPILILGESGVGKTKVAQWLQKAYSSKSEKMNKFLHLNCAVTMTDILRSELFGYEKGAFTGANERKIGLIEEAKNGVIFLDEIGKASIQLQKELYMFIEQKKYRRVGGSEELTSDAKLIFAANCGVPH
jgi:predicted ATP-dependent protease